MGKLSFALAYVSVPCLAIVLYLVPAGLAFDSYAISICLGASAVAMIGWQFILASRPRSVVSALGAKGALSTHMAMPVLIVIVAYLHHLVKVGPAWFPGALGMPGDGLQIAFGTAALVLFLVVIVFALLLFANTPLTRKGPLKALRASVLEKTGMTYKSMRTAHDMTVIAALSAGIHATLASSAAFAFPGTAFVLAWLVFSVAVFARYKLASFRRASRPAP